MAGEDKVVVHGLWASLFVKRVELALKIKGIPYEYVEEDYINKSPLLLKYNPVHKKVPVLVHNGKPIAESAVILEYIDETWTNGPRLLPEDPYEKAKARFWSDYIEKQVFEPMFSVLKTEGEAQEKAVKEVFEKLKVLEEGIKDFHPDGTSTLNSQNIGLVDILIYSIFVTHKAQEEVTGVKVLDPKEIPLICSWIGALNEIPEAKELIPPHEKVVGLIQFIRHKALQS